MTTSTASRVQVRAPVLLLVKALLNVTVKVETNSRKKVGKTRDKI